MLNALTGIMITHEMRFAREVGDTLVFMHQSQVHEVGDPKVLFANPQTAELANFIGTTEGQLPLMWELPKAAIFSAFDAIACTGTKIKRSQASPAPTY